MFEKEFAPNSKNITFVSGFKTSRPLVEETGASKIKGFFFGLYDALMAAPNQRCVSLIEGLNHLNERKGPLILATRFQPHSNYTVTSFDAIWRELKVSFYGGRGILAFSHLLSYRFLFSAM